MAKFFRCPKTTAERKAVYSATEQGCIVRAARQLVSNSWDDIAHARRGRCDRHKDHRR